MASRYPKMKNGMYYGGMSDELASVILQVTAMETVENFRNTMFTFPDELIFNALEEGISVRKYLRNRDMNAGDYIGSLRDYQTVGAAFLYLSPRSVICDGVGLGKTVEVAALLNVLKVKGEMSRFILAVENAAVTQTCLEMMRRTGLMVLEVPSTKAKMTKYLDKINWDDVDGIVVAHSALKSDTFLNWLANYAHWDPVTDISSCSLFDTIIIDESAVIKNRGTKVYQYTEEICKLMKRVHMMNATPFETSIMDVYNQIDLLDPTALPSKSQIQSKYCRWEPKMYWVTGANGREEKTSWNVAGYKNEAEFKNSLKLFCFGRFKEDLKNIYETHDVYPTLNQLEAINRGGRYQEILNCPTLVTDDPKFNNAFNPEETPKLDKLLQLCEQYKDKKIMVYVFHREAQNVIKEHLEMFGRRCVILNGAITKNEVRQEIIDGFNGEEYDVIITNIKRSLNLYDGDVCILYSVESNPAKLEQIRGRIERNVDEKVKKYIMLVYKGTPEYALFKDKLVTRGKDAKKLTTGAKTAIDYFIEGEHFE